MQRLLALSREALVETEQARFRANFGTEVCEKCDGLKAGRGVTATCYQLKRCRFTNVKESEVTPQQKGIIQGLLRGT